MTKSYGSEVRVLMGKHFKALSFSIALSLLICSRSLLVTASKTDGKFQYDPVLVVTLTELAKLGMASSFYMYERSQRSDSRSIMSEIDVKVAINYAVPAILYAIQNNIVFYALKFLNPPTFELYANLKIVTTAIAYRVVMKKPLTQLQYVGICLLTLAAVLGQLGNQASKAKAALLAAGGDPSVLAVPTEEENAGQSFGLLLCIVYALLSAAAGIFSEWTLKGNSQSTHLQNIEIYFWSVVVNLMYRFGKSLMIDADAIAAAGGVVDGGWFAGFDTMTWIVIFNGALMGQCVSFVMKYADNIVKVFAACIALFLSTLLSWAFFAFEINNLLVIGFCLAIMAMFLYFGPHNAVVLAAENASKSKDPPPGGRSSV